MVAYTEYERELIYLAALVLVERIDYSLSYTTGGRVHYRTKSGQLLRTLDQVVRAILADDLMATEQVSDDG